MANLNELAKLVPNKVIEKVYDDAMSSPAKQAGKLSEDALKTARLILAPIEILGALGDRFEEWVETIRCRVPKERRTQAPAHIAGPVLERLKYIEPDSPLKALYLNLLTRAIDKKRQSEAHPAFARIIEQLSPDEAVVLYQAAKAGRLVFRFPLMRTGRMNKDGTFKEDGAETPKLRDIVPSDKLAFPDRFGMYVWHLEALMLFETFPPYVRITEFGQLFATCCLPLPDTHKWPKGF